MNDDELSLVRAVERAEKHGTVAQQANALDHLARHYHEAADFRRAAPYYKRALTAWRQLLGPQHPTLGTLLVNLGRIYLHLNLVDEADPLFRQAAKIFEDDVDFDDEGVVASFAAMVEALKRGGRAADATRLEARVHRFAQRISVEVRV